MTMCNVRGPLLLGFFLHWGSLMGARVCAGPIHHSGSSGDPFGGPLSSILAATEGVHVGEAHRDGGPQQLRNPGPPHEGGTHVADVVGALEGARGANGQQPQPRDSGKHLSILLYVLLTAIFITLVGVCCFFWLRRLRGPKAAAAVPEQGIPHRFLVGRWGWSPAAVRRSSSSKASFAGAGRGAPLYPPCPEGPGALCAPHIAAEGAAALGAPLARKLGHRKLVGPADRSATDASTKETPGGKGTPTTAESLTTALAQRADEYVNAPTVSVTAVSISVVAVSVSIAAHLMVGGAAADAADAAAAAAADRDLFIAAIAVAFGRLSTARALQDVEMDFPGSRRSCSSRCSVGAPLAAVGTLWGPPVVHLASRGPL